MTRRDLLLLVVAAAGVGLIVAGLLVGRGPRTFPAVIDGTSDEFGELVGVLERVEAAAASGDVARLAVYLTARYHEELRSRTVALGGAELDGFALHAQGGFVGDLSALRFAAGAGAEARAALVWESGRNALTGHALLGFVFDGSDGAPRLDAKRARALQGDEDARAVAAEWARELLH